MAFPMKIIHYFVLLFEHFCNFTGILLDFIVGFGHQKKSCCIYEIKCLPVYCTKCKFVRISHTTDIFASAFYLWYSTGIWVYIWKCIIKFFVKKNVIFWRINISSNWFCIIRAAIHSLLWYPVSHTTKFLIIFVHFLCFQTENIMCEESRTRYHFS
jgi:hypothetical protein